MRRREFISILGSAVISCPVAARAQQTGKVSRIGFLGSGFPTAWASRLEAMRAGLRDLGYEEGKNITIEFRWADGGRYDLLRKHAAELVRLNIDVLITYGTPGTLAAKHATTTIPIVMVHSGDAVATGIIASLAKPGGNITGSTLLNPELMAKRLEMLKEFRPSITQVAVLLNPDNSGLSGLVFQAVQARATSLNVVAHSFDVRGSTELEGVFSAMAHKGVEAVVVLEDPVFVANARAIAKLAEKSKLLSAGFRDFAGAGGLLGYGANYLAMYRHAAVFVDKILKGTNPANIPVEQPMKFDLVFSVKTAKALGFAIPTSILLRADELIE